MENDIQTLIGQFSGMVEELNSKIDGLSSRFDEIMNGAESAYSEWDHNNKKKDFSERNADFLTKYSDKLKAIEGDDFDLAEEAMKVPEGADEAQYIAALAASIDEQLDKLRTALGDSAVVEATNDNGDTEVKADSEPVAEVKETEEAPTEETEVNEDAPADEVSEAPTDEVSDEVSDEELEEAVRAAKEEEKAKKL